MGRENGMGRDVGQCWSVAWEEEGRASERAQAGVTWPMGTGTSLGFFHGAAARCVYSGCGVWPLTADP